jgi:hypothetical protein
VFEDFVLRAKERRRPLLAALRIQRMYKKWPRFVWVAWGVMRFLRELEALKQDMHPAKLRAFVDCDDDVFYEHVDNLGRRDFIEAIEENAKKRPR